jgi:hypothetical protein
MTRLSLPLLAAVIASTAAGSAYAWDSSSTAQKVAAVEHVLEPAFSNTIVSTYPDGRQARLWLEPDGGYRALGRRGEPTGGTWRIKGEKLCLRQSHPFSVPFSYCTPVMGGEVGDVWIRRAVTGELLRVRLERGRPDSLG